ncbi:tetratricopeptide repeat protein [Photobacterium sp. GJ3]|uniref:tetratricopeptide repeat protein n=1 Tax=Photobacterium sp. GJ3 TaxID=2829502 RepID=UPI001B8B5803|nr:tetratricopeptide repeat protein [Photobacterium sp. GJ3]QUJ68846.1 tetratricopeptide repeat protein [Photobacterium sp. GJ3]
MNTQFEEALALRKAKQYEASRTILTTMLEEEALKAKAHLQIAWSYDNEGKEREAVAHYEAALKGPISENERFDAVFGLASTLRSLGNYHEALKYFEQTKHDFPDLIEVQPFHAMCLHNLGRHQEAMAMLLELLLQTTSSTQIQAYQRAIRLYAENLDKQW